MAVLTLDYLRGAWTVRRAINGDPDAFTGAATFTPDGDDGLVWREVGHLHLDGYRGPARRTLLVGGDPPRVRFDDGRFFHDLRTGAVAHDCAPDTYHGVFTVAGPDGFTVAWTVTGPDRADVIESVYRRRADGETVEGRSEAVTRSTL